MEAIPWITLLLLFACSNTLFCNVLSTEYQYNIPFTKEEPSTILAQYAEADAATSARYILRLQQHPLENYQAEDKEVIKNLIQANANHTDELIKLAGFLGLCDFIQAIRYNYESGTTEKLAVNLALVRCSDEARTDSFIANLKKAQFGDAFIYEVVPMMIYTRNQKVFELLEEHVNRTDKSCTTEGETGVPTICGYRIIEQLASVLYDFPYNIRASGDLETKDYALALQEIRIWLASFENTFPIIKNTY